MADDKKFPWWFDPNHMKWDAQHPSRFFGDRRHFLPWYDVDADYNTNAKSYYDYLGFRIKMLDAMIDQINKLLRRDLQVVDTSTIDMEKENDWVNDDTIFLSAKAKLSTSDKNAIKDQGGLYAYDYGSDIANLENKLHELESKFNELENKVNNLVNNNDAMSNALTKIINRLENQGAWNGGMSGDFTPDQSIATGNINVYGISRSSNKLIKTHEGDRDGDIIQGLD